MKKGKKVLLCILLILLAAIVGVCIWQWDNMMAIKTSLSTSQEDIAGMMADNDQKIADAAQKVDGVTVRDLTDEEKQALRNGDVDREELLDLLTKDEETSAAPDNSAQEPPEASGSGAPAESQEDTNQKKLSKYLAEIYLLKAEYTAWLEDTYDQAIADYNALEESERTATAKYRIGMSCMKEALAKEKECDAQMADLEQKISDLLKEMGEDTSLVDDIQTAYEEEKALKKAYYLGLHN